jgi:tyrosyl-tRNA synthetase
MQLGGSDQWGNIIAGIDLIKSLNKAEPKEVAGSGVEAYGMTIPLLTTSNGEKFGKSAGNAVWLDETRTGISDFYQVSLDISLVRVVTDNDSSSFDRRMKM